MKLVGYDEKTGKETVWLKIEPCCQSKCGMYGYKCQGVKGHKGLHWAYSQAGWLEQWPNKKGLKRFDIAHTSTPPGGKGYVTPGEMQSNRPKTVKVKKKS